MNWDTQTSLTPSPSQRAPEPFKLKALSNLIELLRADEQSMMAAQARGQGAGLRATK